MRSPLPYLAILALGLGGCVGTTGGDVFEIQAYASGPDGLVAGEPYAFSNGRGYDVRLDQASLHVGAAYLNHSRAVSVAADTSCALAGIYVAEVTQGLDVDLLSPELQAFGGHSVATSEHALTGEVWLMDGDVNAPNSDATILALRGEATRESERYPFSAQLTIGQNRAIPPPDPALPGANPICKQRIVSPVPVELTLDSGTGLVLRVDAAHFFANVDFSTLAPSPSDPTRYEFSDARHVNQASDSLYAGLRATLPYRFSTTGASP